MTTGAIFVKYRLKLVTRNQKLYAKKWLLLIRNSYLKQYNYI